MNVIDKPSVRAFILLWAFAESGIGGILHALKLPFTGLLVGGLAIVCISLTAYWSESNRKAVLEALFTVILVKLAVSPHSPWQAYVAVLFQGYLGFLLFRGRRNFALRALLFSVVCMMESALQKMLMAWLIYGTDFFKALDKAALSAVSSLGWQADGSVLLLLFGAYLLLYLFGGILLGLWIPRIPVQTEAFHSILPPATTGEEMGGKIIQRKGTTIIAGFVLLSALLLVMKFLVPQLPSISLLMILVRSVLVSLLLIFVVAPIVMFVIRRLAARHKNHPAAVASIISQIPLFTQQAAEAVRWVSSTYKGVRRIRYAVLALLVVSLRLHSNENHG